MNASIQLILSLILIYLNIGCTSTETAVIPKTEGEVLMVSLVLYTDDISSINDKDMDFQLDYYLKHQWNVTKEFCEPYLEVLRKGNINLNSSEVTAVITKEDLALFWIPDTVLTNAKKERKPSASVDTRVLRIKNYIEIGICSMELIIKISATVSCPMDFHAYPKEKFACLLNFRSYSHNLKKVIYKWDSNDATPLNPDLKLLQHYLQVDSHSTNTYTFEGNFSVVQATFTFQRQLINKVSQVYFPSLLSVGLSWLSFWTSLDAIPGRVTLCIMSVLAISVQFVSVRQELPRLSYITVIDIWMLGCLICIFGSLVEYTIVKYLESIYEKHVKEHNEEHIEEQNEEHESELSAKQKQMQNTNCSVKLESYAYFTSPQYPLVPGYNDYLLNIIQNRMPYREDEQSEAHIGLKPNYGIDFDWSYNEYKENAINSQSIIKSNFDRQSISSLDSEYNPEVLVFKRIDRISRVIFPLGFCLFAVIYWWILIKM